MRRCHRCLQYGERRTTCRLLLFLAELHVAVCEMTARRSLVALLACFSALDGTLGQRNNNNVYTSTIGSGSTQAAPGSNYHPSTAAVGGTGTTSSGTASSSSLSGTGSSFTGSGYTVSTPSSSSSSSGVSTSAEAPVVGPSPLQTSVYPLPPITTVQNCAPFGVLVTPSYVNASNYSFSITATPDVLSGLVVELVNNTLWLGSRVGFQTTGPIQATVRAVIMIPCSKLRYMYL